MYRRQVLKTHTREVLYEKFRTEKLLARRATRKIGEEQTKKLLQGESIPIARDQVTKPLFRSRVVNLGYFRTILQFDFWVWIPLLHIPSVCVYLLTSSMLPLRRLLSKSLHSHNLCLSLIFCFIRHLNRQYNSTLVSCIYLFFCPQDAGATG